MGFFVQLFSLGELSIYAMCIQLPVGTSFSIFFSEDSSGSGSSIHPFQNERLHWGIFGNASNLKSKLLQSLRKPPHFIHDIDLAGFFLLQINFFSGKIHMHAFIKKFENPNIFTIQIL